MKVLAFLATTILSFQTFAAGIDFNKEIESVSQEQYSTNTQTLKLVKASEHMVGFEKEWRDPQGNRLKSAYTLPFQLRMKKKVKVATR
jgi:hypothetical protein